MKPTPHLNIAEPLRGFVMVIVCFHAAHSVHWYTYIISIFYTYCGGMDTEAKWRTIVLVACCTVHLALERVSHGELDSCLVLFSVNLHLFPQPVTSTCQARQLVWPPALNVVVVRHAHTQLMDWRSHQHMAGVSRLSPAGLPTCLWLLWSSLAVISGFDPSWNLCHSTSAFLSLGCPLC